MWLKAPNIQSIHGFSTRHGGVSSAPFDSLNLGGSDDAAPLIEENRKRALHSLGLGKHPLSILKQVHGVQVCEACEGKQEGDALVTKEGNRTLAIGIADCYPVLFEDATAGVIGAAHAGWRGTLGKIVVHTLDKMLEQGARRERIQVAIGQGISQQRFEVGEEVLDQFWQAGFPKKVARQRHLDLNACLVHTLTEAGIDDTQIWSMKRCTYEDDFFSYRRDKGTTGRMWGLISTVKA